MVFPGCLSSAAGQATVLTAGSLQRGHRAIGGGPAPALPASPAVRQIAVGPSLSLTVVTSFLSYTTESATGLVCYCSTLKLCFVRCCDYPEWTRFGFFRFLAQKLSDRTSWLLVLYWKCFDRLASSGEIFPGSAWFYFPQFRFCFARCICYLLWFKINLKMDNETESASSIPY